MATQRISVKDLDIKVSEASISIDGLYRWWLYRCWEPDKPVLIWVMMNPSTADWRKNDPTICKTMRYAARWGYGGILVLNIYAYRTSRPENLPREMSVAVGPKNDWWLSTIFEFAADRDIPVICAWGVKHQERGRFVRQLADDAGLELQCLEVALNGEPKHPRFLSEDLRPRHL